LMSKRPIASSTRTSCRRALNANILSAGKPSDYSTQILERNALSVRFKSDPEFVLAELNSGLGKPDERDRLFALSEWNAEFWDRARGLDALLEPEDEIVGVTPPSSS
jgi:hypothetical protein